LFVFNLFKSCFFTEFEMKKNYDFLRIFFLAFLFLHANVFAMKLVGCRDGKNIYRDSTNVFFSSMVITPPESSGSPSSSSSSSDHNYFDLEKSDTQTFSEMLEGDLLQDSTAVLAQDFVKRVEQQQQLGKELITRFKKAFLWAAQKGWAEVIKVFLSSDKLVSHMTQAFCRGLFSQLAQSPGSQANVVTELLGNESFLANFLSLSDEPEERQKFVQILNLLIKDVLQNKDYLWVKMFLCNSAIVDLMDQENLGQAVKRAVNAGDQETLGYLPKSKLEMFSGPNESDANLYESKSYKPKKAQLHKSKAHRDNCNIQ
jgi:hypothetical protein